MSTTPAALPRHRLGKPRYQPTVLGLIRTALRKQTGVAAALDPRHVLAWIVVSHPVDELAGLSVEAFEAEVSTGISCALASTARENEQLALSLDL